MTPDQITDILRRTTGKDIDGIHLYSVLASELPQTLRAQASIWGHTSTVMDLSLCDWLKSTGRWRGRGPAVVVNDLAICDEAKDLSEGDEQLAGRLAEQRIVAVAIHELAHTLEQPFDLRESLAPEIAPKIHRELFAAWCKTPDQKHVVPFHQHDLRFIRVLCHVIHRAEQLPEVERIPRRLAFDGCTYSLSNFEYYESALADELRTFSGTFAELRATQPPAGFVNLWRSDLRRFADDLASVSQIVNAIVDGLNLYSPTLSGANHE